MAGSTCVLQMPPMMQVAVSEHLAVGLFQHVIHQPVNSCVPTHCDALAAQARPLCVALSHCAELGRDKRYGCIGQIVVA